MAALVLQYYVVLRSILRAKPRLRRCRTRCPDCGIFFLTHPCNFQQRGLIRCPFGCRREHRRREARRRSSAYYSNPAGKEIKKKINQRRCRRPVRPPAQGPTPPPPIRPPSRPRRAPQIRRSAPSAEILQHVRLVVRLIEGRRISRRQVQRMMAKILRQHTLTRRKKIDQAVVWLQKQPP